MNNVRKIGAALAAVGAKANEPAGAGSTIGTDLGTFERNPCGECWHWKRARNPGAPLDQGTCMLFPPVAFPVQGPQGVGLALTRPVLSAAHEGCDQWDDTPEDDGDGEGADAPRIAAAGA